MFFPDFGLLAYDTNGKEQWRTPLGPFNNIYGMGASPIIVGRRRSSWSCDQSIGSFIAAFDRKTGKERWRTARTEAKSGHSTPILYTPAGGRAQILVPGSFLLSAYDPRDGKRLWWVGGLSFELKSTPVIAGDTLYINGFGSPENQPGSKVAVVTSKDVFARTTPNKDGKLSKEEIPAGHADRALSFADLDNDTQMSVDEWDYYKAAMDSENGMLAITLGGSGDMTAKSVKWRFQRGIPQLPSPLLYKNVLYMVNDAGGIVTTLNPATGRVDPAGAAEGADRSLLRVAGRRGRQDLHRDREGQGDRPSARRRARGDRGQRPRGQHLRDARARGRQDLRAHQQHAVLLREEMTPLVDQG